MSGLAALPIDAAAVLDHFSREDFLLFVRRVFAELKPNERFVPSLAVEAICAELTYLMDRQRPSPEEDNKVIFNLPPRHLKSLVCSVAYPLFLLGHDPSQTVISVTYGDELTRDLAEQRRRVAESGFYRRLFPQVKLTKSTVNELRTSRGGSIYGTSVGGALTGRGANHFVVDDPIKAADIYSKAKRDACNEWLGSTLASRPDDKLKGRMILVMQRLHVDDPTGVLLRTGQWYVRRFAAIAERDEEIGLMRGRKHRRRGGEVLDPVREPLRVLDGLRATMTEDMFSAQYQQQPVPPEGGLFKLRYFEHYDRAPTPERGDTLITSWDTALSESERADYSVGMTWLVRRDRYHLLDLKRGRMGFPELQRAVLATKAAFPTAHVLVERAGSGMSLWQSLKAQGVDTIAIKVDCDKVQRAQPVTLVLESGRIQLPRRAPWLDGFLAEVAAFPANASHDDQVDSMVQAINWWEEKKRRRAVTIFSSY